ncbi:MAG: hypothetical protein K9M02_02105 [Thiohalocapsa sp.]|nr:hypothetical protein [Thiohalocapsa sp.]
MIFDSLTLAGLAAAAPFLLMPLLMGREFLRVDESSALQPISAQSVQASESDLRARHPDLQAGSVADSRRPA